LGFHVTGIDAGGIAEALFRGAEIAFCAGGAAEPETDLEVVRSALGGFAKDFEGVG